MTGKQLVDTNLLVYAYDRSEVEKQAKAVELLDEPVKNGSGILSPQILSEFYTVVTRKLAAPLTRRKATQAYPTISGPGTWLI
jgi:predicted nucleic acid-binding protein